MPPTSATPVVDSDPVPKPHALGFRLELHGQKWTLSRIDANGKVGATRLASIEEIELWQQLEQLWEMLAILADKRGN